MRVKNVMNEEGHRLVEMDAKVEEIINEAVPLVFKTENIVRFIKAAAENYLQDYRNQILIWRQRENAGTVVAKKSLMKMGLVVPDTTKPVAMLYPVIVCVNEGKLRTEKDGTPVRNGGQFVYERVPEFQLKYEKVSAYDVSDAVSGEGELPRMTEDIDIFNAVRGNVSFVVETDEDNSFSGKGVVDYVNGRFVLKPGLSARERDRIMLVLFADYITQTQLRADRFYSGRLSEKGFFLLSFLLGIAVPAGFGMLTEEFSLMPLSEAEDMDTGEKRDLLMCFNLGLQAVMEALLGKYLTFDETALCNSLLRQDQEGKVMTGLVTAPFPFRRKDHYIDKVMTLLSEGLADSGEDRLRAVCGEIRNQSLTSYPPHPFP